MAFLDERFDQAMESFFKHDEEYRHVDSECDSLYCQLSMGIPPDMKDLLIEFVDKETEKMSLATYESYQRGLRDRGMFVL